MEKCFKENKENHQPLILQAACKDHFIHPSGTADGNSYSYEGKETSLTFITITYLKPQF